MLVQMHTFAQKTRNSFVYDIYVREKVQAFEIRGMPWHWEIVLFQNKQHRKVRMLCHFSQYSAALYSLCKTAYTADPSTLPCKRHCAARIESLPAALCLHKGEMHGQSPYTRRAECAFPVDEAE